MSDLQSSCFKPACSVLSLLNQRFQKEGEENTRYIPEELIFDILTKLPPKALLRFKSVSKNLFNGIITSKPFIDARFAYLHSRPGIVITSLGYMNRVKVAYSFLLDLEQGSCIPLTRDDKIKQISECLNGFFFVVKGDSNNSNISLRAYNLTGLEYKDFSLPPPPSPEDEFQYIDNWEYMFGFDPITKSYKVLACSQALLNWHSVYFIITLGKNANNWRKLEFTSFWTHRNDRMSINGTLYLKFYCGFIVFDFSSDKFRVIERPDYIYYDDYPIYSVDSPSYCKGTKMFQFGQNLGQAYMDGTTITLWKLEEHQERIVWVRKHKTILPIPKNNKRLSKIVFHPQKDDELLLFFGWKKSIIISWNLKTSSTKLIEVSGLTKHIFKSLNFYVPSLVSPRELLFSF